MWLLQKCMRGGTLRFPWTEVGDMLFKFETLKEPPRTGCLAAREPKTSKFTHQTLLPCKMGPEPCYKRSYNYPYKWLYKRVTGIITPINGVITRSGPYCTKLSLKLWKSAIPKKKFHLPTIEKFRGNNVSFEGGVSFFASFGKLFFCHSNRACRDFRLVTQFVRRTGCYCQLFFFTRFLGCQKHTHETLIQLVLFYLG